MATSENRPSWQDDLIHLTVNGKPQQLDEPTPLVTYVESIGVSLRLIAIAVNGTVMRREELQSVTLNDGDEVEIVRAVGGG
mgnify:CR=1 FL=1